MTLGEAEARVRELQRPCGYCGHPVVQPGGSRRLLRYCGRSCRQRAYELRRAEARREADLRSGRVLAEPVERVVERIVTVEKGWPVTTAGWEAGLAALAEQLSAGVIPRWQLKRIRAALAVAEAALDELAPRTDRSR